MWAYVPFSFLAGVCAVQAEWIPKLLPQYCHFSAPEENPAPWYCPLIGRIKCQQQSTFCKTTALSFNTFTSLYIFNPSKWNWFHAFIITVTWGVLNYSVFIWTCCVFLGVSLCSQSQLETSRYWDGLPRRPWALQTVCKVCPGGKGIICFFCVCVCVHVGANVSKQSVWKFEILPAQKTTGKCDTGIKWWCEKFNVQSD